MSVIILDKLSSGPISVRLPGLGVGQSVTVVNDSESVILVDGVPLRPGETAVFPEPDNALALVAPAGKLPGDETDEQTRRALE